MIIVGASNVYCIEVENLIAQHEDVEEVAVVSAPREPVGEEVVAVVTLAADRCITLEDIRKFCEGRIAAHKIPTRLEVVDALPRTAVQKIDKKALRERFWGTRSRQIR